MIAIACMGLESKVSEVGEDNVTEWEPTSNIVVLRTDLSALISSTTSIPAFVGLSREPRMVILMMHQCFFPNAKY